MSVLQRQVAAFHRLRNQPIVLTGPAVPDEPRVRLRANLIAEEFFEVLEAIYGDRQELHIAKKLVGDVTAGKNLRVNLVELADGLADLDYVVEGTRLEFGIDGDPIAAEVHRANMTKVGGEVREDGKILKPKQWTAPDIEGVLQKQVSGTGNLRGAFLLTEVCPECRVLVHASTHQVGCSRPESVFE